ncbi:MAG: DNA alkylation repair protein [Acidobacteriota bacterium]
MAEPLKNSFGPEVPETIARMVETADPSFDSAAFLAQALDGYDALELTPRAKQIAAALAEHLPADRQRALEILIASLGPEIGDSELTGMEVFVYLPHVYFVAEHGLEHFDLAMRAQYELTKRFTAEFSLRAYIERYPAETLARLHSWADDPNVHVRRLVSEGCRPRLPWAPRLRRFQEDPAPVLELLELLKDDSEEYVRRSVANCLNDIAKDHPDRVVETVRRWWPDADPDERRMIRHALRTLIKQGNAGALGVLGYGSDSPVVVRAVRCTPESLPIGGKIQLEIEIVNPSKDLAGALVDLRVHFVKANGSTAPKVFKGGELELGPGEQAVVRKKISVAQHSTRTHYPGRHTVEVLLNGTAHPGGGFDLTA